MQVIGVNSFALPGSPLGVDRETLGTGEGWKTSEPTFSRHILWSRFLTGPVDHPAGCPQEYAP